MKLAILTEGGALLIALLLASFFAIELFPLTHEPVRDLMIGTAAAIPPFLLFLFSISNAAKNIPFLGSLRKMVLIEIREVFSHCTLIDIIIISLLAGFGEEFLFRGLLQTKLGIVAASIIFGLFHAVSPAYVIAATIMGFYIGVSYQMSGSLLVPVQIHFVYDLAALVYIKNIGPIGRI
ncbi:CAAX amino terminal protease self- immunity [bacterium BMS3Abin09]|nr:CAAX amino terminal protease self- immunity [bacterium BMS3Abin09]GBE41707.1 CAAX amino terminal protease self- immunity [bacterium BMS3Bbin09]